MIPDQSDSFPPKFENYPPFRPFAVRVSDFCPSVLSLSLSGKESNVSNDARNQQDRLNHWWMFGWRRGARTHAQERIQETVLEAKVGVTTFPPAFSLPITFQRFPLPPSLCVPDYVCPL